MTRTVHFQPKMPVHNTESNGNGKPEEPEIKLAKNPYEAFGDAARDAQLVVDKLKGLFCSSNRHGDLQIVLSASLRIGENARAMIEVERS